MAAIVAKHKLKARRSWTASVIQNIVSCLDTIYRLVFSLSENNSAQMLEPKLARRGPEVMHQNHIRHFPVVGEKGRALAVVSMRNLLEEKVQELNQQWDSLESYFASNGIGG